MTLREEIARAIYDDNLAQANKIEVVMAAKDDRAVMIMKQKPFPEQEDFVRAVYLSYADAVTRVIDAALEGVKNEPPK